MIEAAIAHLEERQRQARKSPAYEILLTSLSEYVGKYRCGGSRRKQRQSEHGSVPKCRSNSERYRTGRAGGTDPYVA